MLRLPLDVMALIVAQLRAMPQKFNNLWKIIKHNGGVLESLKELHRNDEIKHGQLVGEDKFGNRYYENNDYFYLRNRWVVFSHKFGYDYDASNICPEWHRWMHHGTDKPPSTHPPIVERWMTFDACENKTGTIDKYVPYSTTKPQIQSWTPPK